MSLSDCTADARSVHDAGGWSADDDQMPLWWRVRQHQAVIDEQVFDHDTTVLAVFPSPVIYAGLAEVRVTIRSR